MGRISIDSASLREKKETIMEKILDKIGIQLNAISETSKLDMDTLACKNVETLVYTFNSLDTWAPDKNQSPTPEDKPEE